MKKSAVSFALFALFLGAEAPSWFLSPNVDSTRVFGLGSASSIDLAKKKAIEDLSNSLQVSVKSTFDQTKTRHNKNITSHTAQTLNLESQIDDLTNIEPTRSECEDGMCYVQVEIKKSDLIAQLRRKIEQRSKELLRVNSPFTYTHKKEMYAKMQKDYTLYVSLGGVEMQLPALDEKPAFSLVFEYDGEFSSSFKSVLQKTIQEYLTKFGKLSDDSAWKIVVGVFQEGKSVTLDISTHHDGEVLHNASVYDTQKPNVSSTFFAKRLGVQAYKKMQKWGTK